MKCSTAGLMQVKDYHPEEGKLEVRTTSLESQDVGSGGGALAGLFASNYLLVS